MIFAFVFTLAFATNLIGVPRLRSVSMDHREFLEGHLFLRAPKLGSRSYNHAVLLIARSGDSRLARTPTSELWLDIGLDEVQARRAIVDDAGDELAMGLAGAVTMEVSKLSVHFSGGERTYVVTRKFLPNVDMVSLAVLHAN
jgi:hypothetical protein